MLLTSMIVAAALAQSPAGSNRTNPASCVLDTAGGLKYLYAKNPGSQVLVLRPVGKGACKAFLASKKSDQTVKLRRGGDGTTAIVTGAVKEHTAFADDVLIEVTNVGEIPEGAETWTLETSSGPAVATMVLVVRALEVKTERVTVYGDKILQDIARANDLVQGVDFIAAKFDAGPGLSPYQPTTRVSISAADLPAVDGDSTYWLLSTSAVELPDAQAKGAQEQLGQQIQEMPEPSTLASVQEQRGRLSDPYKLRSLVGIRMVGGVESASPVVERLLYVRETAEPDKKYRKPLVLLDTPVKLAESMRRVQLPLPVADSTYVLCPTRGSSDKTLEEGHDGGQIAVHNSSVTNRGCKAVFSPDDLKMAVARRHGIPFKEAKKSKQGRADASSCASLRADRLNVGERCIDVLEAPGKPNENARRIEQILQAYGSQRVAVSVTKDGVEAKDPEYVEVYVDAANREDKTLTFPDQDPDADKPYTVTISSELAKDKKSTGAVSRVSLRPRGLFGFRAPIRMFVTIPLNLSAIRFPASVRDAASSSESLRYQIRTFDVGALASVELWDYVRRKNMLPIPIRLSTGFLFNPVQRPVAASWVVGGSFNLPLIEGTSQVDTSFAIGLYYEVDMRHEKAFRQGSHFLLTFGVNIFSLFGAESAKKK